jgi:LmbE family N-acetylglucosaminyl deacetylase/CheY-like chemotaxis protein
MENHARILIIEDNSGFMLMMWTWLSELPGVECFSAQSGSDALAHVESGRWDLIISDIELPDIDGISLAREAKSRFDGTQVLVITGAQRVDYAVQAVNTADAMLLKPFSKEEFLREAMRLLAIAQSQRAKQQSVILAIGAHPDDVEIGCGGSLIRHKQEGASVIVLTLSGGESGGASWQRREESSKSAQLMGAILRIKDLPDTRITNGPETIKLIEEAVQEFRVSHVYMHSANDAHQDHRNTHAAAVVACRRVPNVLCYQSPSTTVEFRPTLFTEISGTIEQKLDAIAQFESQTPKCPYLAPDLIMSTARYWGRFSGYGRAEAFEVLRQSS